jgi:hypothetical protein
MPNRMRPMSVPPYNPNSRHPLLLLPPSSTHRSIIPPHPSQHTPIPMRDRQPVLLSPLDASLVPQPSTDPSFAGFAEDVNAAFDGLKRAVGDALAEEGRLEVRDDVEEAGNVAEGESKGHAGNVLESGVDWFEGKGRLRAARVSSKSSVRREERERVKEKSKGSTDRSRRAGRKRIDGRWRRWASRDRA